VSDVPPRGSVAVFAVAFVVMLAAGVLLGLAAREFLQESMLLWVSIALSVSAVVLAVLAAVLPRRS
jgi:hypothetical protein